MEKKLNMQAHQVIRQERHAVGIGNLSIAVNGEKYEITNYSLFGVAFKAKKPLNLDAIYLTELFYGSHKVADLSVELKREENIDGSKVYGAELITSAFPVDEVFQIYNSYKIIGEVEEKYQRYSGISDEVKYYIDDLYIWLSEVECKIKNVESFEYETAQKQGAAEDGTISIIGTEIANKIKQNNSKLNHHIKNKKIDDCKIIFEYYRYRLGKFIFQSPFTKRSYTKPRGYAGDFEMMNIIYRNDMFAKTLFGACMEKAVNLHEEPSAVRNRMKYLSEKIIEAARSKKTIRVLSVACGPAEEIKECIRLLPQSALDHIQFDLLDQDEDALKYAQQNIRDALFKEGKQLKISLVSKNIKDLILSSLEQKYDLIYSAGLFDYFSDAVATRAAKGLFKCLQESGKLVIGNFNSSAPNTFGMLALFDWYLILRDEKDLVRLFTFDGSVCRVESEENNVNLFCVINKK